MEIKVQLDNKLVGNLPDLSYDQFCKSPYYQSGSSDIEYENYLRQNSMIDLNKSQ